MMIPIVVHADEHVLRPYLAQFGENGFDNERRGKDLLEAVLERGAQGKTDQSAECHVLGRAVESFDMRGFDGRLAKFFDVHWMTQGRESVAVINLEDLGVPDTDAEHQDAFWA